MCLAIPARIHELPADEPHEAIVDVLGVRRRINLFLLQQDRPAVGDWVLVHVGFAMSRIRPEQAHEQLALLRRLGEQEAVKAELDAGGGA